MTDSTTRLIPADAHRRERWKNGLGWTNEIARGRLPTGSGVASVEDVGDAWDWRLSIAEIDRDCGFSSFPGIDRTLVLLDGAGMQLHFEDGERTMLSVPGDRVDFAGERTLSCTLVDGPTRDFNVMSRRDGVVPRVDIVRLSTPASFTMGPREILAVHLLAGSVRTSVSGAERVVSSGQTLLAEGASAVAMAPAGGAALLIVRLMPIASS